MASETKQEPCRECDGEGRWYDASHGSSRHCQNCDGTGFVPVRSGEARQEDEEYVETASDFLNRIAYQVPPLTIAAGDKLVALADSLDALAVAVKGCGNEFGTAFAGFFDCGARIGGMTALCAECTAKRDAAITSLLDGRTTT